MTNSGEKYQHGGAGENNGNDPLESILRESFSALRRSQDTTLPDERVFLDRLSGKLKSESFDLNSSETTGEAISSVLSRYTTIPMPVLSVAASLVLMISAFTISIFYAPMNLDQAGQVAMLKDMVEKESSTSAGLALQDYTSGEIVPDGQDIKMSASAKPGAVNRSETSSEESDDISVPVPVAPPSESQLAMMDHLEPDSPVSDNEKLSVRKKERSITDERMAGAPPSSPDAEPGLLPAVNPEDKREVQLQKAYRDASDDASRRKALKDLADHYKKIGDTKKEEKIQKLLK